MVDIGTCLRHYKREDIQKEMLIASQNKEVAVKYADKGFGKRPDTLIYPKDIIEFAKNYATSFHVSEELWKNPLQIVTGMKKKELDDLRIGWDLILDIDCSDWKISKIITWLIIECLKKHKIKSISVKFSGNKGFHVAVPFNAFPKSVDNIETKNQFPDLCRNISYYLIDYISKNMIDIKDNEVIFNKHYKFNFDYLAKNLNIKFDELVQKKCLKCEKIISEEKDNNVKHQFICINCNNNLFDSKEYMICDKCNSVMEKKEISKDNICQCGSNESFNVLNAAALIDLDTLLISSRHLYRLVYSLHEKSNLASIPFNPEKILHFKKEYANPKNLKISKHKFLDTKNTTQSEGTFLIQEALKVKNQTNKITQNTYDFYNKNKIFSKLENDDEKNYEIENEIPKELFPPCINKILNGLDDGRKRGLFILLNFFINTGYGFERINKIIDEWNLKNTENLRKTIINSQINYRKYSKKKILPPNCDNKSYYRDLGICIPDNFCQKIKNPVNYSVLKSKLNNTDKSHRKKLTKEQKEMRKKFREKKNV
ncbi:MAG: hypothetical protein ACOC3X_00635 [Nanoarchaeota archaeon]